jgi:hypothetical protein
MRIADPLPDLQINRSHAAPDRLWMSVPRGTLSRTVWGWLGSVTCRHARLWSLWQLHCLVVEAGLVFPLGSGAVYYPSMSVTAKPMLTHDRRMSVLGQMGAAFQTVRADKPG